MTLKLYYASGACSFVPHSMLEMAGATFEPVAVKLHRNEQNSPEYKAINPRGESVRKASMDRFRKTVEKERALLLGQTSLLEYDVDSIVPPDDVAPSAR